MEREEEFRENAIYEIKRLKLKVKYLYILVFVLFVYTLILTFI